jgi:outer membrane protein TolC
MKPSALKTHIILFALILTTSFASAQSVDYNKIILPDGAVVLDLEEKLVQLAWRNNPKTRIATEAVNEARFQTMAVRTNWTNTIGITGNMNEFNIKSLTETSGTPVATFFPRYNFYVNLPLSLLVQTPNLRKAAQARTNTAEEEVKLLKLQVRNSVLKLYKDYKLAEKIFQIRQEDFSDEESSFKLMEEKFKTQQVAMEDYLRAHRVLSEVKIQREVAENNLQKAKLDIEQIIGVRLEDVR